MSKVIKFTRGLEDAQRVIQAVKDKRELEAKKGGKMRDPKDPDLEEDENDSSDAG